MGFELLAASQSRNSQKTAKGRFRSNGWQRIGTTSPIFFRKCGSIGLGRLVRPLLRTLFVMLVLVRNDGASAYSQEPVTKSTNWRKGNELDQYLLQPISVSFSEEPFKECLISFSQQQRIAIFVDRRLDPGLPISLVLRDVTIEQLFWKIAADHDCGVCRLGNLYYFGPTVTAASLPLVWQQLKAETSQRKQGSVVSWSKLLPVSWPELSVPDEILQQLAIKNGFRIKGDAVAPDLWSRTQLPAMALDEQVGLLVVGFGKWFERTSDGSEMKLIDFTVPTSGTLNFQCLKNDRSLLSQLRKQFPECQVAVAGKSLQATGSPSQLAQIQAAIVSAQKLTPRTDLSQQRYTLTTRSSRGEILATIAQQTGRKLEFDPSLNAKLEETIELKVENISLEDLIKKTLDGTGVSFEMDATRLIIRQ